MGGCKSTAGVEGPASKSGQVSGTVAAWKSSEDLKDFETFFPAGTKSSLSKNLTAEIWNEYKDQKCDMGVTFKTCIYSGVKNLDSGIGLYAGSHGAYTKFNKLFDKVI